MHTDEEKYKRCVEDIGELLQKAVRTFQQLERVHIKSHGFTSSQCHVLLELHKNHTLSINAISEKMKLEISTVTRIMNNLVRDGLVVRQKSRQDKRIVEASLTEQGVAAADELQYSIEHYYRDVIEHLPRGHVREVMRAVEHLVTALEKANPKEN